MLIFPYEFEKNKLVLGDSHVKFELLKSTYQHFIT